MCKLKTSFCRLISRAVQSFRNNLQKFFWSAQDRNCSICLQLFKAPISFLKVACCLLQLPYDLGNSVAVLQSCIRYYIHKPHTLKYCSGTKFKALHICIIFLKYCFQVKNKAQAAKHSLENIFKSQVIFFSIIRFCWQEVIWKIILKCE